MKLTSAGYRRLYGVVSMAAVLLVGCGPGTAGGGAAVGGRRGGGSQR
jgi:hypothetical protein